MHCIRPHRTCCRWKNKQLFQPILNRIRIVTSLARNTFANQTQNTHNDERLQHTRYGSVVYSLSLFYCLAFSLDFVLEIVFVLHCYSKYVSKWIYSCIMWTYCNSRTSRRSNSFGYLIANMFRCFFSVFVYVSFLFIFGCEVGIHQQRLWAPSVCGSQTFDAGKWNESIKQMPYRSCPITCRQRSSC